MEFFRLNFRSRKRFWGRSGRAFWVVCVLTSFICIEGILAADEREESDSNRKSEWATPPATLVDHVLFMAGYRTFVNVVHPVATKVPGDKVPETLVPLFEGTKYEKLVQAWMSPRTWDPRHHLVYKVHTPQVLRSWVSLWDKTANTLLIRFWGRLAQIAGETWSPKKFSTTVKKLALAPVGEPAMINVGKQNSLYQNVPDCPLAFALQPYKDAVSALAKSYEFRYSNVTVLVAPPGKELSAVIILSK